MRSTSRSEEYRQKAEEAERLAGKALTDEDRRGYQRIAEGWRELEASARMREKRGH